MENILVTGAAGFIGSTLVRKLVEKGHKASIVVRKETNLWRLGEAAEKITRFDADLTDLESIKTVVSKINPTGVFHLAASNIQSGVTAADDEVIRTNVLGIVNLLKALEGAEYKFFINTGSFLEYRGEERPLKESDVSEPGELYSITKLAATLYGEAIARRAKKPIITFRIFSPYGPGMQKGRLLEALISKALKNEPIAMTNKDVTRDFVFVEDIADLYIEAMDKAMENKGEVFNLGTGVITKLHEVVDLVIELTNSKSMVAWNSLPSVSYDRALWQADMTKTFSHFDWRPKFTFESGVRKTIEWYKKNK